MSSKPGLLFFGKDGRSLRLGMWHTDWRDICISCIEVCRSRLRHSTGVGQVRSNSTQGGR